MQVPYAADRRRRDLVWSPILGAIFMPMTSCICLAPDPRTPARLSGAWRYSLDMGVSPLAKLWVLLGHPFPIWAKPSGLSSDQSIRPHG
jgi:hypothetical protein